MKKNIIPLVVVFLITTVCVSIFFFPKNDAYNKHKSYRQTFGIIQYETLNCSTDDSKKEQIESVFNDVKDAILYSGSKENCEISEPLNSLCRFTDEYNYKTNKGNVKLVAYKNFFKIGYLWVEYTRECYDDKGNIVTSSYDTLCLIKLKDIDNNYEIIDVIIEP